MSSQASSAGHGEAEVRHKLVETGDVDVMISIRSNFFYTRTVPCELWHFDRSKPADRRDKVLMIDARSIYRKVTRKACTQNAAGAAERGVHSFTDTPLFKHDNLTKRIFGSPSKFGQGCRGVVCRARAGRNRAGERP